MRDLEKMGIVGTKLFWELFTTSIKCRGVDTERIIKNIEYFKLFIYWARSSGHKYAIRRMFFEIPNKTPFKFLEYMIQDPYTKFRQARFRNTEIPKEWGFDTTDVSWYLIFYSGIARTTVSETVERYLALDCEWKKFFKKVKFNLL